MQGSYKTVWLGNFKLLKKLFRSFKATNLIPFLPSHSNAWLTALTEAEESSWHRAPASGQSLKSDPNYSS